MATLTTLATFNGTDGAAPEGSLITDANGDLLGITPGNGVSNGGTVFEVTKTASGFASTPTVLANLDYSILGANAGLVADANGDLFGTTRFGGVNSDGSVFEITKTASGYASTPTVLVSFNGTDGLDPITSLMVDANGNLFGTTTGTELVGEGLVGNDGTVFEIAKTAGGYASTPTTLVSFNGTDGASASGGLIADANGDLFGTTNFGGANDVGTVFEIAKTASGYASTPTVLVSFNLLPTAGGAGADPSFGLITDANGDLFGTTSGGGAGGHGTVFEIAKTASGYASTPTVLYSFTGSLQAGATGGLTIDAKGDLFGTSESGVTFVSGMVSTTTATIFEIANTPNGYASTPTSLVSVSGVNQGYFPEESLIADANGDLFGSAGGSPTGTVVTTDGNGTVTGVTTGVGTVTTGSNGTATSTTTGNADGSVFEISDSGYQVACFCRGTHILTEQGEVPVESLAIGERVITHAGAAAPIRWIGFRSPNPKDVPPVRVRAHAFGEGQPHRDLWLSPDHAVFSDGVLIPIRYLINGATISEEGVEHVTYYHVELDQHNVLLAEGLACESYLDTHNRSSFANGATMQPSFSAGGDSSAIWEAAGCAALQIAGPAFDKAVTRLRKQAKKLGYTPARLKRRQSMPRATVTADLGTLLQPEWYLATYPDVAAFGMDARKHYFGWGRAEGRLPCPESELIHGLGLVDPGTLIFNMEDVVTAGIDPVQHFCEFGWREGRRPNAYFDTNWYLATHDVPAGMNPLLHYVLVGETRGWSPSRLFDPSWYRRRYALAETVSPLAHYLAHRRSQLFSPLPSFDVTAYTKAHAKTLRPNRDPYVHFLAFGNIAATDTTRAARLAA